MYRADFHIIRRARGWYLQNAEGQTLQTFRTPEDAFEAARNRAKEFQRRGFSARVTLHHPGKAADVYEFVSEPPAGD